MAITITCTDGANDFDCCDGSTTNDHDFSGVMLDDGTVVQRIVNPLQLSRKASSVLVFDENSNYRDVLVSEVSAASTVNELAALLVACRSTSGSGGGFSKEVFTGVSNTITVSQTLPSDKDMVVVMVGGLIAKETTDYSFSGQDISFTENPDNEVVQVFIFT